MLEGREHIGRIVVRCQIRRQEKGEKSENRGGKGEKRHHVMNSLEFFKLLRGCLICDADFS